jgi:hypothetical protein
MRASRFSLIAAREYELDCQERLAQAARITFHMQGSSELLDEVQAKAAL